MAKLTNEQIDRFIMSFLLDSPELKPPVADRFESNGTIHAAIMYTHGLNKTPAVSRVDASFERLWRNGYVKVVIVRDFAYVGSTFWGVSDHVQRACDANLLTCGDDLFSDDPAKASLVKVFLVGAGV